jgi:ribosome-binding protein aMBF1 (putative translation factor)
MADTNGRTPIWEERERLGLSRERVAAQLEPPISAKTLERWEKRITPAPLWRLQQLARLYGVSERRVTGVAA